MRMMAELRRRNVLRMAVLYAVVFWLIVQVADVMIGLAKLPDWIGTTILWLLVVGFPIALIFSWFYELTPEGISREKDVEPGDSITHATGRRLDFIVISLLCAAVILFAYDKWWIGPPPEKSIAVLAFENMSGDPDQEFFSDGISEELLNQLAKIPELRVTSRSSAFSFKGKDFKIADVGRELNVSNVLEGSVRKAGNMVRITAQLIRVDGDVHLWSETYDRSLDNIFAIQDEIASEVVTKLKITLLGHAPDARKTDPQAYALYLQGRHLRRQTVAGAYDKAQALLQQALEIDPDYAEAWAELASTYTNQANLGLRPYDEAFLLAREAINKAITIDPEYAQAHANLGYIARSYDNDLVAAAYQLQLALQLEPANTNIIRSAASLIMSLGRLDEAIALSEFVVARDPVSPRSHSNLALYYTYAGRWDNAIASSRTAQALSPGYSGGHYQIGIALLFKDEPQAALEAMQAEKSIWGMVGLPLAYHALGRKDESDAALAALIEEYEKSAPYNIAYIFAYRNEVDLAFEWLDKAEKYKDTGLTDIINEHLFSNLHEDPRWLPFLERIGYAPAQLATIEFKVTLPD
jgi:TolB-like protein/Tfp pilus assembly protein PilF